MSPLREILAANRAGKASGIPSICSAHPLVLEACIDQAVGDGLPLLVESTCNQVNQEGGYTGMRATDFRSFVAGLAAARGLPEKRLILGGDHLGPNPWRHELADNAMAKAETLVRSYAAAGFGKLHLDASMACAGDPDPLPAELIADRATRLCRAAEDVSPGVPVYVVGTEVPVPGGAHETIEQLEPTRTQDLAATIELHRAAFAAAGLDHVWPRVVAVVVQPGVEFGSSQVVDFAPDRARDLAAWIDGTGGLVFEAHSTDYQTEAALKALVALHFAILKVGPGLTFALREALFALAAIENEWIPADDRSQLRATLEAAMLADPSHWQGHYPGTADEQRFARAFSLSDRARYYWPVPVVAAAVERLLDNLTRRPPPLPLLGQYLPRQHDAIRTGRLAAEPQALIRAHVAAVAGIYARACGATSAN